MNESEDPLAENADEVLFADFAHEMGPHDAALANALRCKLGIKKTEVATKKIKSADANAALTQLKGGKK